MDWLYTLFEWTWEHKTVSAIFIAMPLYAYIIIGPLFYLAWGSRGRDSSFLRAVAGLIVLVAIPISYFLLAGFIGYWIYS